MKPSVFWSESAKRKRRVLGKRNEVELITESVVGMAAQEGLPGLPVQRLPDFRFRPRRLGQSLAIQIFALLGPTEAHFQAPREQGPEHVVWILVGKLLKQLERLVKLCLAPACAVL